jgi:hypothetical protein
MKKLKNVPAGFIEKICLGKTPENKVIFLCTYCNKLEYSEVTDKIPEPGQRFVGLCSRERKNRKTSTHKTK